MVTITRDSIAELEQECEQYKKQCDELIEDIEKLRKDSDRYEYLTNYIKNKALHNPGVHRYIDLVHVIEELERDTHEG